MKLFTGSLRIKILSLLLVISVLLAVIYYGYQLYTPIDSQQGTEKLVEVKRGGSLTSISQELYRQELINNPFIFKTYVKLRGLEDNIQAGYYRLDSKMTIIDIVDKLVVGRTANYQFTVPEGATIKEIANKIEGKGRGLKKERFLQLAKQKEMNFLSNVEQTKYNLEGFLFPETYRFSYSNSEEQVISKMVQEFHRKINFLTPEIESSNYSLYEIITIASLIEAEAQVKEEPPLVSSVIYNRLQLGMKLQLDATIQYILSERKSRLLYSDLEVDSLYNTYQYYGLPPGPINNPGLAAIKAALRPAETDYLYYVAVGDGRHKFTKTYEQHLKVQRQLRKKQ